jgi:hypothetical protein
MTILKLSYVASSGPSAPPQFMPADMVLRDAPRWRRTADGYELILFRLVEHEQLLKSGAQIFMLSAD